jgi:hypothetical protein
MGKVKRKGEERDTKGNGKGKEREREGKSASDLISKLPGKSANNTLQERSV